MTSPITSVPFLDLRAQHAPLRAEVLAAWADILDTTAFVSGRHVAAFEEAFAAAHGVDHCVAVSTGTDALILGLRALGVATGDKVVLPANTFIATAEAVSAVGAIPCLVDCDPQTRNIDPVAAAEAVAGDPAVRGIIGVHLYGQPADWDALAAAAAERGVWLMEDAAQAHLARYRDRTVGGLGVLAAFSFYPGKNLGAPGEGGAVTTDDPALAEQVRVLRDHGQGAKYHSSVAGYNARMHELVAAVLRIKLPHLARWTERRRQVAGWYRERLAGVPGVELPHDPDWARSVYHLFVVHVADRDAVKQRLERAGIGVGLHYPVPIHLQEAYAQLGLGRGSFPNAERSAARLLSLPMYAELAEEQVDYVCEQLAAAVSAGATVPG